MQALHYFFVEIKLSIKELMLGFIHIYIFPAAGKD